MRVVLQDLVHGTSDGTVLVFVLVFIRFWQPNNFQKSSVWNKERSCSAKPCSSHVIEEWWSESGALSVFFWIIREVNVTEMRGKKLKNSFLQSFLQCGCFHIYIYLNETKGLSSRDLSVHYYSAPFQSWERKITSDKNLPLASFSQWNENANNRTEIKGDKNFCTFN